MSVMVHDWILERSWIETELIFKPNGETTNSGLPIGEIWEYVRRKVEARKATLGYGTSGQVIPPISVASSGTVTVSPSPPGSIGNNGGYFIDGLGNLHIGTAGAGEAVIPCLIQTKPAPTPPGEGQEDPYPGWINRPAHFRLDANCDGIGNMILGIYNWSGVFTSEVYHWSVGAWGGGSN